MFTDNIRVHSPKKLTTEIKQLVSELKKYYK
jgi:hypothetical protein